MLMLSLFQSYEFFFHPEYHFEWCLTKKTKSAILLLFYIIKTEIYASTTSDFKKEGPKG